MTGFALEVGLHWIGVALYMASVAVWAWAVLFGRAGRVRWAWWIAAAGLVPHGAALLYRWAETGHGPYMLKYEVLSSNAWVAIAGLLVVTVVRPAWTAVAVVVMPLAILMVAAGLFTNPEMKALPPTLRSAWLVYHVVFAKLSAAAFLLSLAASVLLLGHARLARAGLGGRLPAPDVLDALTLRFVGFGFIFWTVTIAAGAIWAQQSWGRYWGWDAIETWSLVTWLVYGAFLHARLFFRLRHAASAWACIGAFGVFVLTLIVFPYLIPSLHAAYFQ